MVIKLNKSYKINMTYSIVIQNLKCGGCARTIKNRLAKIDTISNLDIDVEKSIVLFDLGEEKHLSSVKSELKALGYPEQGELNSFGAKAKSFVSCAVGRVSKDQE